MSWGPRRSIRETASLAKIPCSTAALSDVLRTSPPPPNAKQRAQNPSNGSRQRHRHPQDERQRHHLPLELSLPFDDRRINLGRLWGTNDRIVQSDDGFSPGVVSPVKGQAFDPKSAGRDNLSRFDRQVLEVAVVKIAGSAPSSTQNRSATLSANTARRRWIAAIRLPSVPSSQTSHSSCESPFWGRSSPVPRQNTVDWS